LFTVCARHGANCWMRIRCTPLQPGYNFTQSVQLSSRYIHGKGVNAHPVCVDESWQIAEHAYPPQCNSSGSGVDCKPSSVASLSWRRHTWNADLSELCRYTPILYKR